MDEEQDELFPEQAGARAAGAPKPGRLSYALYVEGWFKYRRKSKAAEHAGYSAATAYSAGNRLHKHPKVAALIEARSAELREKYSVDHTLDEIARIAFFDPRTLYHANGIPKTIQELDDDAAAVLRSFNTTETYAGRGDERYATGVISEPRYLSKEGALDMLMRYHSLYRDKLEQTVRVSLEDLIVGPDADSAPE